MKLFRYIEEIQEWKKIIIMMFKTFFFFIKTMEFDHIKYT